MRSCGISESIFLTDTNAQSGISYDPEQFIASVQQIFPRIYEIEQNWTSDV